ncbi:MAG: hypothetical protein MJ219_00925 [Mycoplasmoidaceae bacterium]|nr:hypothetical protein [Mycoplasmoidaceae bacterium]
MVAIKQAIEKGLDKHKKPFPIHPRMLILNGSECAVAIAKIALKDGFEVTIADQDLKHAESLRRTLAFAGKINVCDAHYETILEQVRDKNIFIATTINPSELTKLRITKEMAVKMPEGSLLVDTSCQNGYAFHFIKKFADKELK